MNQDITSDVQIFLKRNFIAVLATSYLDLPYASIIYYTIDEKLNFYFVTKANTDKYLNLKINRNVAVAVGGGNKHTSVQVRGHTTILKDKRQRKRILEEIGSILKKNAVESWPVKHMRDLQARKKELDEEIVYKVIPQHLIFTNLDDHSLPSSVSNERHCIIPILKRDRISLPTACSQLIL